MEITPRRRSWLLFLGLTTVAFSALIAGGHSYSIDNEIQFQTTRSLVQLKPELESVDRIWIDRPEELYRVRPDGTYTGLYGIGQSIVAAPTYIASRAFAQLLPVESRDGFVRVGTFFTNSLIAGFLIVTVALLAFELSNNFRASCLTAVAYSFGTYSLPHTKTFFTEPISALFLSLAVLFALRWLRTRSPSSLLLCGTVAGFGVMTRISAAIFIPILAVWLFATTTRSDGAKAGLRSTAIFFAGGVIPLGLFLFFNWWRFGNMFDIGYPSIPSNFPLTEGLFKVFFSPGKSLFLFAPILLLSIPALILGLRKRPTPLSLILSLSAANLLFFSRYPFWTGDAAWGPRYQQIILPILCVPAVLLAGRRWFTPALGTLTIIGFLAPAMLGSLIYFNVLFIDSDQANVGSAAITNDLEWQPMLETAKILPQAVRDVIDPGPVPERGTYSDDTSLHYGYFGLAPRVDFWWLWRSPMSTSLAIYFYFVPVLLLIGTAAFILRRLLKPEALHEFATDGSSTQSPLSTNPPARRAPSKPPA